MSFLPNDDGARRGRNDDEDKDDNDEDEDKDCGGERYRTVAVVAAAELLLLVVGPPEQGALHFRALSAPGYSYAPPHGRPS